jgi:group I intron endonuclease
MEQYLDKLLEDDTNVLGEIYLIRNTQDNKCYVGQTLTHRYNRGKYRPFGYDGRFKDHISAAMCNTKTGCAYLASAMRKYGLESFTTELVERCAKEDLDEREIHYIASYDTMFPNGYNLTPGGKATRWVRKYENDNVLNEKQRNEWRYRKRSEETKKKMSERAREIYQSEDICKQISIKTHKQHLQNKFLKFPEKVSIDLDNLDKYIRLRSQHGVPHYRVVIDGKFVSFCGKHDTLEELKSMAIDFLKTLAAR